jgi:type I restriction enzyme S subunit
MSRIDGLIAQHCGEGIRFLALDELSRSISGLSGKSKEDFGTGEARYVPYKNVFANLAVDQSTFELVRISPTEKQNRLRLGDVLITGSSESVEDLGMSSVVDEEPDFPLYLNSFCFAVRFNDPSQFLPGFTKHLFRSNLVRSQIRKSGSGVTRINVSKPRFMGVRIPVPPLEVQAEIVRVLDNFTELETKLETELKAELNARHSQFHFYRDAAFKFEDSIPRRPLGELALNLDNRRRPVTRDVREPGPIPYFGASGVVDYVKDYIFDGDYLLVSEDGANLLARSSPIAFSVSGKTWVNNHAHVLEFSTYEDRRFVEIYLNSIDLAPYVSGAAQPKLNKANLNQIAIPDPPFDVKKRTVATLDKFDAALSDLSVALRAELSARRKQYEYYREELLTFSEVVA